MAEVTHSTRRGVLAGAIAAGSLAVCATPVVALAEPMARTNADLMREFLSVWRDLDTEQRIWTMKVVRWYADGNPPDQDPRQELPEHVKEHLRAGGLM